MGSNGGESMKMSETDAAECSATTVEIKIKTLNSQTYNLRVDKCVPVPELKEQIASVTGVLSEQQRLICRGKVMKDDQLLSAYHVEDGHTLHLVVRQPVASSSENSSDQPGTYPTSSAGQDPGNRVSPSVLLGTFNISEQGDGALPDLNRIVSSVLNSLGLTRFGSGVDGIDLNQTPSAASGQSASTAVSVEPLQPPIIPDSLTTLLQYLSQLTQEFVANSGEQNANSENAGFSGRDGQDQEAVARSTESRRVVTPEFLAEVMSSTRQLLVRQAADCLLQLAGQLNSQTSMTDPLERSRTQSYALRSGALFQNLGSLLLEFGRAVMTLRMGQSSADALVNAGPSVFVSPTGPNPIMVQTLPFQPGASLGSVPVRSGQPGSGLTGGSGFLPRNIDIRIRTGSVFPRRAPIESQNQGQGAPVSSSSVNSVQQDSNSQTREAPPIPQVRPIPIRTVVAGRGGSDSSRGSIGILYPVLARVQQHVPSSNLNGGNYGQPIIPDSAAQPQNTGVLSGNGNSNAPGEVAYEGLAAQMQSGLEQFLTTVFTGDHLTDNTANPTPSATQTEAAAAQQDVVGTSQEAAAASSSTVTDEGIMLSNILRQIMPIISQNNEADSNMPPNEEANSGETQVGENSEQGTSSRLRRRHNPQSQQNPKRQKKD